MINKYLKPAGVEVHKVDEDRVLEQLSKLAEISDSKVIDVLRLVRMMESERAIVEVCKPVLAGAPVVMVPEETALIYAIDKIEELIINAGKVAEGVRKRRDNPDEYQQFINTLGGQDG